MLSPSGSMTERNHEPLLFMFFNVGNSLHSGHPRIGHLKHLFVQILYLSSADKTFGPEDGVNCQSALKAQFLNRHWFKKEKRQRESSKDVRLEKSV